MRYLEIEAKIAGMAKNLDRRYIRAFWIAFALVNLAFLFYTVNFMFGDHDWNYVRGASAWNEGAFEGRPLHFVLQAVLFDGQVLPFLNSLFSFAALVLGYILLARYWQVPLTTFNYALFAVFAAVLPYTLVWLYYAKDMLINLSLPLVCVASLLAASAAISSKRPWLHVPAMALMLFAFASYAAVINFYAVCLLGSAFFAYAAAAYCCRQPQQAERQQQKFILILHKRQRRYKLHKHCRTGFQQLLRQVIPADDTRIV